MNKSLSIVELSTHINNFKTNSKKIGAYVANTFYIPKLTITKDEKKKLMSFSECQFRLEHKTDLSWCLSDINYLIDIHLLGEGHFSTIDRILDSGVPKYDLELIFLRGFSPQKIITHSFYLLADSSNTEKSSLFILYTLKYIELLWGKIFNQNALGKYLETYTNLEEITIVDYEKEQFFEMYLYQMLNFKKNPNYFSEIIKNPVSKMEFKDFGL